MLALTIAVLAVSGNIWPDFGKDKVGDFKNGDSYFNVKVEDVVDGKTMLCKIGTEPAFLVTKYDTSCIVDGKTIRLRGEWKCVGTKKHNCRTVWVIEPK